MKRFLTVLLAGLMLLSLAACGEKKDDVKNTGVFEIGGMEGLREHDKEKHPPYSVSKSERFYYDNLSSALMDLESGKVYVLGLEQSTADYITAHNDKITSSAFQNRRTDYSMMTMDSNKEIYDILNNAIKDMKEDGTLDTLIENELKAYIESDPVAKDLPHFDGARTIKVGVTGDVPPMDFVAANGKAAGFNIALLTEIANRAQVNIEIVQIESGARPMALSSGKVDVVFWTKNVTCLEHNESWAEKVEGTLVTESYFSDYAAIIKLKDNK